MGLGTSILLIAVGAVIRFALTITWRAGSVNWNLVGDILIAVGVIALILSVYWMTTASRRSTTVVERPPA